MITIQEPFFFRLTFTSVSKNYNFSFWHIYIQVYSFEYRFTTSIIFCNSCILSLNKTMSSAYIRRYKFNILSSCWYLFWRGPGMTHRDAFGFYLWTAKPMTSEVRGFFTLTSVFAVIHTKPPFFLTSKRSFTKIDPRLA